MMGRAWKRPRRVALGQLALLAAGLLLLGLVLRSVSPGEVLAVLRELTVGEIAALALVNALILISFSGRWWIFLRAQGHPIGLRHLLAYRLTAFGISYFTPGPHLGGEPYQVYAVVRRHRTPLPVAIAAVTLDKLLEMLLNFSFLVGGVLVLLLHRRGLAPWLEQQLTLYALLLLALPAGLLAGLALGRRPLSALLGLLDRLAQHRPGGVFIPPNWQNAVRRSEEQTGLLCRRHPRALLAAAGVSVLSWIGLIGEFWLLTRVLGLQLTVIDAATALVAARIAILLPLPAGLGALEASQALAMQSLGLDPGIGVAISLLLRARDVLLALLGLWIGGVHVWQQAGAAKSFWESSQPEPTATALADPARLAEGTVPAPPL
jgi:uncharacterized protein (TIRG00374 family)